MLERCIYLKKIVFGTQASWKRIILLSKKINRTIENLRFIVTYAIWFATWDKTYLWRKRFFFGIIIRRRQKKIRLRKAKKNKMKKQDKNNMNRVICILYMRVFVCTLLE